MVFGKAPMTDILMNWNYGQVDIGWNAELLRLTRGIFPMDLGIG